MALPGQDEHMTLLADLHEDDLTQFMGGSCEPRIEKVQMCDSLGAGVLGIPSSFNLEALWLGILFAQTLAILVLQLVAGFMARSLALLADSGHSVADCISYGVGFGVEILKKVNSDTHRDPSLMTRVSMWADLAGAGSSTALLCIATWYAGEEAISRLHNISNPDQASEQKSSTEFMNIGPALLVFALVSTMSNLITLVLFQRWRIGAESDTSKVNSMPVLPVQLDTDVELVSAPFVQMSDDAAPFAPPPPPPPIVPVGRARPSKRDRKSDVPSLNLTSDFAAGQDTGCGCGDSGTCASSSSWGSWVHMLVHPGCASQTDHKGDCRATSGEQASSGLNRTNMNLNVHAAMLHLVADVLRGITILGVAIAIETGLVSDSGKADAVCALLVAAFVALGSVDLLRRFSGGLCSALRGSQDS